MSNNASTSVSEFIPVYSTHPHKSVSAVRELDNLSFFSELLTSVSAQQERTSRFDVLKIDDASRSEPARAASNSDDRPTSIREANEWERDKDDSVESDDVSYTGCPYGIACEYPQPAPESDQANDRTSSEVVSSSNEQPLTWSSAVPSVSSSENGSTKATTDIASPAVDIVSADDRQFLSNAVEIRDSDSIVLLESDRSQSPKSPLRISQAPERPEKNFVHQPSNGIRNHSTAGKTPVEAKAKNDARKRIIDSSASALEKSEDRSKSTIRNPVEDSTSGSTSVRGKRPTSRHGRVEGETKESKVRYTDNDVEQTSVPTLLQAAQVVLADVHTPTSSAGLIDTSIAVLAAQKSTSSELSTLAASSNERSMQTLNSISKVTNEIQPNTTVTSTPNTTSSDVLSVGSSANSSIVNSKPTDGMPARGSSISPYQETKLTQRVLRGLEQLGEGGGQVRLRLHPPELGSLQMTIRIESGHMFAKMEVENSIARDALLNNVQTLKDRLAEQGMQVDSFEVQISSGASNDDGGSNLANHDRSDSRSRWDNASSRYAQRNANQLSSTAESIDQPSPLKWIRNNGSLDLTV